MKWTFYIQSTCLCESASSPTQTQLLDVKGLPAIAGHKPQSSHREPSIHCIHWILHYIPSTQKTHKDDALAYQNRTHPFPAHCAISCSFFLNYPTMMSHQSQLKSWIKLKKPILRQPVGLLSNLTSSSDQVQLGAGTVPTLAIQIMKYVSEVGTGAAMLTRLGLSAFYWISLNIQPIDHAIIQRQPITQSAWFALTVEHWDSPSNGSPKEGHAKRQLLTLCQVVWFSRPDDTKSMKMPQSAHKGLEFSEKNQC